MSIYISLTSSNLPGTDLRYIYIYRYTMFSIAFGLLVR